MVLRTAVALCLLLSGGTYTAQKAALPDLAANAVAKIAGEIPVSGLRADVQVIRDEWGVPHIYASSEEDLFFAQGYVAAQDRLWQMEMWRRAAEGRLAEILGPQALPRDRMARLLRFRGAADEQELTKYHPRARTLMAAFVNGINAFIANNKDRLPVEFVRTGIEPHQGWEPLRIVREQIAVRGGQPETIELKFSRHGQSFSRIALGAGPMRCARRSWSGGPHPTWPACVSARHVTAANSSTRPCTGMRLLRT